MRQTMAQTPGSAMERRFNRDLGQMHLVAADKPPSSTAAVDAWLVRSMGRHRFRACFDAPGPSYLVWTEAGKGWAWHIPTVEAVLTYLKLWAETMLVMRRSEVPGYTREQMAGDVDAWRGLASHWNIAIPPPVESA